MKKILILILSALLSFSLFAEQTESINIEAVIAEDYGIVIPKEAIAIDRLIFEIELESGENCLLEKSELALGELSVGHGESSFTLLYYGNLSSDYDVVLTSTSSGLYAIQGEGFIPIEIEILRDKDCMSVIETTSYSPNEVRLVVPAIGALEGEPVVKFLIKWDSPRDLPIGRYEGCVDIELRSN